MTFTILCWQPRELQQKQMPMFHSAHWCVCVCVQTDSERSRRSRPPLFKLAPRGLLQHLLFLRALSPTPTWPYHLLLSYPSCFLLTPFCFFTPSSSSFPVHFCIHYGSPVCLFFTLFFSASPLNLSAGKPALMLNLSDL